MSKAVLVSVRPEWCKLIAEGQKTIEVRKSRPKLETPFKCYIYCTYGRGLIEHKDAVLPDMLVDQNVSRGATWGNCVNGKIIGEFKCDGIYAVLSYPAIFAGHPLFFQSAVDGSCLTHDQLEEYAKGKDLCGWHISDLVIYDRPKELGEFMKPCENDLYCEQCAMYSEFSEQCGNKVLMLSRPPQSWCYVEELPEGGTDDA